MICCQKIANQLILKTPYIDDLGLFHGKTGIALFFYHYASFVNNDLYRKVGEDLIHDIFEDIHNKLSFDFENGYCGIGWGFEYLAQHGYIQVNTGELLEELDRAVMRTEVRRVTDTSLNTGLAGILHYVLSRLSNRNSDHHFDNSYMDSLYTICLDIVMRNQEDRIVSLAKMYLLYKEKKECEYSTDYLFQELNLPDLSDTSLIYQMNLGLIDGCAGGGLNIILHAN